VGSIRLGILRAKEQDLQNEWIGGVYSGFDWIGDAERSEWRLELVTVGSIRWRVVKVRLSVNSANPALPVTVGSIRLKVPSVPSCRSVSKATVGSIRHGFAGLRRISSPGQSPGCSICVLTRRGVPLCHLCHLCHL
jgi:hypothetical protein